MWSLKDVAKAGSSLIPGVGATLNLASNVADAYDVPSKIADPNYDLVPGVDNPFNNSSPQVQGASVDGAIYFDTNTGKFQGVGGTDIPNAVGGDYTTGSNNQAPTDPYAKWGGQSAYNNLVSGFDTQKQNIFGSATNAANQGARDVKASILDFLDSYRSGQSKIDNAAINAELAKMQGADDIRGMVSRGINSGGVMLQNRNASASSAADAIARAYAQIGSGQMRNIGNQYAQKQNEIGMAQDDLGVQVANFNRDFEDQKIRTVNSIVSDVASKLGQLDAQMANADLPGRIAIEQEKQRIKGEALSTLSQFDQMLFTEKGKIQPKTQAQRAIEAKRLQQAGTDLGANAFNYSTQAPSQLQNTGPFASELPIFTNRYRKEG